MRWPKNKLNILTMIKDICYHSPTEFHYTRDLHTWQEKMHNTVSIYLVAVWDQLLQRTHLFIDPVPSSLHQHSAAVKNAVRTIYQQAACLSENRLFFASTIWFWSHPLWEIMDFSCTSPSFRPMPPRRFGLLSCLLTLGILQFPHQLYSTQASLFPSSSFRIQVIQPSKQDEQSRHLARTCQIGK